jgi:CheY-like chemotaxis protein
MASYQSLMLVDDDIDDHEIFLSALESVDASVYCAIALNGRDALNKLIEKHVNPDLIFLDINMPLMSGTQFLKEIKKIDGIKNIPVVIYSTTSASETIGETKALGAHDFISKPDSFADLEKILKDILSKRY